MGEGDEVAADRAGVRVPAVGALVATEDLWEPYRLVDANGVGVGAVAEFLKDLQAAGRPATTQRSYGMALLRWFRFLWAHGIGWDQATRVEARDFCRWLGLATKPRAGSGRSPLRQRAGAANAVTGKPEPGVHYAPATAAHSETVLRSFYEFHRDAGSGPMVNPFPLSRRRREGRAHAHHNPMEPYRHERAGLYRPRVPQRVPRRIPDEMFDKVFARLGSHRDRALVALWVSTGARASELLGACNGDADAGQQLITVVRKGSRAVQPLPASPDAFVWLRLYQAELDGLVPSGRDDPLWWTLRRPFHRLSYHGAYRMFSRVNAALGANWSLHDLRHTAAYRMARDPHLVLTDVQWVLGHAHLSSTQRYLNPVPEEVIAHVVAHYRRRAEAPAGARSNGQGGSGVGRYRPEALDVLFGGRQP